MIQTIVGLWVQNQDQYSEYRASMQPILVRFGGRFTWDVDVAHVRVSPQSHPINRLFSIGFESEKQLKGFFEHPEYLEVRARYFEPSVTHITSFGRHELLSP